MELAILLGLVAGMVSAVAIIRVRPRPRTGSRIQGELDWLAAEKNILDKTIAKLYEGVPSISEGQRDKLLIRYQNQLGVVLAKMEKLEAAKGYPDLGPLGDGLVTLMDQKMSGLDERLSELSSRIGSAQAAGKAAATPAPRPAPIRDIVPAGPSGAHIELSTLTGVPPGYPFEMERTDPAGRPAAEPQQAPPADADFEPPLARGPAPRPGLEPQEPDPPISRPKAADTAGAQDTPAGQTSLDAEPAGPPLDDSADEEDDATMAEMVGKLQESIKELKRMDVDD